MAQRDAHRDQREVHRDQVGQVPGAPDGRRPPPDGAGGEDDRPGRADRRPQPEPAEHPPGQRDAQGREPIATASWSVARPNSATNGSRTRAGSGGNGSSARPSRLPAASPERVHVLEVVVLGQVRARRDGVREPGAAVQERVGLPHEVVVLVPVDRVRTTSTRGTRRAASSTPTTIVAARPGTGAGRGAATGPSAILRSTFTLRRRLPVTALGSGLPDRETTTDEAPRRGIGPQIAAILLIGLVFRLIMAYAVRTAPRLRVRERPRPVPLLGRHARDARPVGLLRQRVLRGLHARLPVRPVARRDRGQPDRRHRGPDQAAGDPDRRRARRTSST